MKKYLSAILPILLLLSAFVAAGYLLLQRSAPAAEEALAPLQITELMCRNSASVTDADGSYCQWIELKNVSDAPVELADYTLAQGDLRAALPSRTVAPGSYTLLRGSDWGFPLREDGSLSLSCSGKQPHSINYVNRSENCSWLAETGKETGQPTPGYEKPLTAHKLQLSEAMSHNDNCVVAGLLCDWVELYNAGDEPISLGDYWLSKDESEPYTSRLPDVTLESGAYAVLCCGSDIDFNLGKSGCVLYLTRSDGVGASALALPAMNGSESFTYDMGLVSVPSPGRENGSETPAPEGLCISEVLSANDSFLPDERGEYSDLIELYNGGHEAVELSDYCLSDKKADLLRWALPNGTLNPGEYTVLRCSDASFSLSSTGERLYLSRRDGTVADALLIPAIPTDRSWGRRGSELLYFANPTPGAPNGSGQTALLAAPSSSVSSGFYEEAFSVTLSGEGNIYYTLDGSTPDVRSPLYQGESIGVSRTMSIRCFAEHSGEIPSETVTYNYFIAEADYELDVVMVSLNPMQRLAMKDATHALEYASNIALYRDGEELFNLPCGVSVFGSGSRSFMKKSYQIDFQSKYGPGKLEFPFFDNRDYDEFDSIVLRSGSQDQHHAILRDEILTRLWEEQSDELLTFSYHPVDLYLNNEYEGVYYIRERCTEETVAVRYDVAPESVTIVKNILQNYSEADPARKELSDLLNFIRQNDMSHAENYAYVEERLDMESTIDYFLAQMWSTNYDIGNARMFRSDEAADPRWHFILYDLDVAFLQPNTTSVKRMVDAYNGMLRSLLANDGFREQMTLRLGELLAGPLREETVIGRIDELADIIRNDVGHNVRRWAGVYHTVWEEELDMLRYEPGIGISGWNDTLIRQYINVVNPENELILRAFGEDYC